MFRRSKVKIHKTRLDRTQSKQKIKIISEEKTRNPISKTLRVVRVKVIALSTLKRQGTSIEERIKRNVIVVEKRANMNPVKMRAEVVRKAQMTRKERKIKRENQKENHTLNRTLMSILGEKEIHKKEKARFMKKNQKINQRRKNCRI